MSVLPEGVEHVSSSQLEGVCWNMAWLCELLQAPHARGHKVLQSPHARGHEAVANTHAE